MLANRLTKNIIKHCNKDCLHTRDLRSLALGDRLLPKHWVESHTPYNHHQLSHSHLHEYTLNLHNHHIHHQLYICTMFWDTIIHTGSNKSPKSSNTIHAHSSFFPQFQFTALYCQQWLFLCSTVHISRNLLRRQWFYYMKFNPQPPDDTSVLVNYISSNTTHFFHHSYILQPCTVNSGCSCV